MTDKTNKDNDLLAELKALREVETSLSPALMKRILSDAYDIQAGFASSVPPRARPAGPFEHFLSVLGGWPAMAGLATAAIAGLWIGVNPPDFVARSAAVLLDGNSSEWLELAPELAFDFGEGT